MLRKIDILGVRVTREKREKVLEYVIKFIENATDKGYIVTPNPEMIVAAQRESGFREILNMADVALPDGVGVTLAARFLGKQLPGRITGVDFIEDLCRASCEKPIRMGFLGGGPKVAERAVECLREKYPWIEVKYVSEEWEGLAKGWGEINSDIVRYGLGNSKVGEYAGKREIDILFVAFGAPKQEKWISEHLGELPVTLAMGVGGSLDYLSETISRAPGPVRDLGFEWLYRLIRQPWRWHRQLALPRFAWLVCRERFFGKVV